MLWLVIPVLISMFLIQLYFGRHKQEELGWNTAYGNSVVLIFITATLFNYLYRTYSFDAMTSFHGTPFYKTLYVFIGLIYAFVLLFIDFTHSVNKKIAFFLSSSYTIGITAFIAIVLIYSDIPFDLTTLITGICMFIAFFIFFKLVRLAIPPTEEAEKVLDRRKEKKEKIKEEKRIERREKIENEIGIVKGKITTFKTSVKYKILDFIEKIKDFFKGLFIRK